MSERTKCIGTLLKVNYYHIKYLYFALLLNAKFLGLGCTLIQHTMITFCTDMQQFIPMLMQGILHMQENLSEAGWWPQNPQTKVNPYTGSTDQIFLSPA